MKNESVQAAADLAGFSQESWVTFFSEHVKARKKLVASYLIFVEKLASGGFPPIFEERHLALLLGLEPRELALLTANPVYSYRTFEIPKRSGGQRVINVPVSSLAHSQRWIDFNILRRLPVSERSHGYVVNRSNLSNASYHIGSSAILHLDIKDFFSSITIEMVENIFLQIGYPPRICTILSKLCTQYGVLPQGAPSSPQISNVIFRSVDESLKQYALERDILYSRYVDDLIFSGDADALFVAKHEIPLILSDANFEVNDKKSFIQRGRKKIVTGISIGSGAPKIPRPLRREYARSIFFTIKRIEAGELDNSDPLFLESDLGRLAYWLNVDPDNRQAARLRKRLFEALKSRPT